MTISRRRFFEVAGSVTASAGAARALAAAEDSDRYARAILAEAGLLGYWRMEGNLNDAKGVAPGESRGGEVQFTDWAAHGTALLLDRGQFVIIDEASHLDVRATTVELFFKLTAKPTGRYNPCVIAKRTTSAATRFSVHVFADLSKLAIWDGQRPVHVQVPDGRLQVGEWHHLAVGYFRGGVQAYANVYVDGVPCLASGISVLNVSARDLPLVIGASSPKGTEQCLCAVDEVAVYGRMLTEDEIARHVDLTGWADHRKKLLRVQAEQEEERRRRHEKRVAELLNDPTLAARGQARRCRGDSPSAISLPVGGIGAGCIQFNGKAEPHVWQIFNNHTQARVPHSFFAVRTATAAAEPVVRALQTSPVGPFDAVESLSFRGEYPFGWYEFEDRSLPVQVGMEVFSPHVPTRAEDSAIPCAVFHLTAKNASGQAVEVTILGSQQNAVGFAGEAAIDGRSSSDYGGNVNRVISEQGATVLHMTSTQDGNRSDPGDMTLVAFGDQATATASWESLAALKQDLAADGALDGSDEAGPSSSGQTLDGALAVRWTLAPGETRTARFALTWHFPGADHGAGTWRHRGNMYATWYSDALEVARRLRGDLEELTRLTRLYHDTLYQSNLPHWLLDRISSQTAVLSSKTCFWAADGYFGGFEGCRVDTGCCLGNCAHVWHYAQSHARLFPAVARRMREATLGCQTPAGSLPFRHHIPQSVAFDGQCGEILGAYREYLCSADRGWLDEHWPGINRAMGFVIATWDADEDGVIAGPQHNTLDAAMGGSSSWLGTLYLAALQASERMASMQGDTESARRYRRIRLSGAETQDRTLFNGEYYVQLHDGSPGENYLTGCHVDQLLGQWWARQLNLDALYPPDHVRTALESIFKYNFRTDFRGVGTSLTAVPRRFVHDDDAGTLLTTWPRNGRPEPPGAVRFANEVWTGFEYALAAAMIDSGLLKPALVVLRAASDRYDGRLRTGLTDRAWGYSGNPFGDDECGKFYARGMSVWSVLLACQGFIYDGPAGVIGFRPKWQPDDHASFFTAAEGWGLFTQKRTASRQTHHIELAYGRLSLRELVFELPVAARAATCTVKVADRGPSAGVALDGGELRVTLDEPIVLEAGGALEVDVGIR